MISVQDALNNVLDLVAPLGEETVPLTQALGRVLARPVEANRTQPPFASSAMDGYALRDAEIHQGAQFHVIGESAAGSGFQGSIGPGQAVRIFTGAPVPQDADRVVIQENVAADGDQITITDASGGTHIRPKGGDFLAGETFAPRRLRPNDLALLAAMNIARVPVRIQPDVAILATGDELVPPGQEPGPDQIIASNSYGLHGLLTEAGARPRILPIAPDDMEPLIASFELARGADILVTIGGASVGDHDLIAPAFDRLGIDRSFYKVAMRPGKPLIAGRFGATAVLGLPGNPVSAMVCGEVFLRPMVGKMQGLADHRATRPMRLCADLPPNGPRAHYMRARIEPHGVTPFENQDSSLLSVLARADGLIIRPPGDPARRTGDQVDVLQI